MHQEPRLLAYTYFAAALPCAQCTCPCPRWAHGGGGPLHVTDGALAEQASNPQEMVVTKVARGEQFHAQTGRRGTEP